MSSFLPSSSRAIRRLTYLGPNPLGYSRGSAAGRRRGTGPWCSGPGRAGEYARCDEALRHRTSRSFPFEPGPVVTMYTCGITPYDATHLGHAAVYVGYDVLQRRLRDLGHETRCVRNVTDVDDDLLRKAARARRALSRSRRGRDRSLRRRHGGARDDPELERAAGHLGHRRHPWLHRHGARRRPRLSRRGRGVLRRQLLAELRRVVGYDRATMLELAAERGGNPDDPNKRDPARLRSVAAVGRGRAVVGDASGAPGGRGGTSSVRRWPCASSTRPSISTAGAAT